MPPKWSVYSAILIPVCVVVWTNHKLLQVELSSWLSHLACLMIGALLVPIAKQMNRQIHNTGRKKDGPQSFVYSLGHARLNINLPPPTMWMNMGYWANAFDFPDACKALLREVLKASGLLTPVGGVIMRPSNRKITLLDLGFGCGDQTLYLTQQLAKITRDIKDHDLNSREAEVPLLDNYVGITFDQEQFNYTNDRLRQVDDPRIQIFCADAAKPATWNAELAKQVKQLAASPGSSPTDIDVELDCWILALDTLYHFSPSRTSILNYACNELNASIMAFDLLLADNASFASRLLLAVIAVLMGCPYDTFKAASEYRTMLIATGYTDEKIEIRDISEHVFEPLTTFLREKERVLVGFGWNLGKLKAAKWLFGWWASSGAVRGVVVIARK